MNALLPGSAVSWHGAFRGCQGVSVRTIVVAELSVTLHHHEAVFDIALPIDQVWRVMSDTQHLNELFFGLKSAQVVARDADKASLRGTFGILAPEYDEYPWSFQVPRRYHNVRVFHRGVLKRLETTCDLDDVAVPGSTRVRYVVDVEGSGIFGGLVARYVLARSTRGLRAVEAMLRKQAQSVALAQLIQWPPANLFRDATLAKARPFADAIVAHLNVDEQAILERLVLLLADGVEADLARLRPFELAEHWGTARLDTLTVFLRAAKGGLLRLSWDLLCPSCEAPSPVATLKDVTPTGHCPACDIDFTVDFTDNVEATFSPEPQVRQAERLLFCHGSPSSTKSWLAQFATEPGATSRLQIQLGAGRYRLQTAGQARTCAIEVVDVDDNDVVSAASATIDGNALPISLPRLRAGLVELSIYNTDQRRHRVQFVHRVLASAAATAADVSGLGLFRELFGDEVLSPDQHVGVGRMTILFTDLVGSTAMYELLGDAAAYGLVRQHFKVLTAAIERHRGRVVKTVGDAVMAAFDLPEHGAAAGRACIEAIAALTTSAGASASLHLKVGVHTGPCLAIEANGAIDYFGRTVNVAARVESIANADELVLSWTMTAVPQVKALLEQWRAEGATTLVDRRLVKGIATEVEVTRVSLAVEVES